MSSALPEHAASPSQRLGKPIFSFFFFILSRKRKTKYMNMDAIEGSLLLKVLVTAKTIYIDTFHFQQYIFFRDEIIIKKLA